MTMIARGRASGNRSCGRSGAVERSPGYVQFIKAAIPKANQETSERQRSKFVSARLAPIRHGGEDACDRIGDAQKIETALGGGARLASFRQ